MQVRPFATSKYQTSCLLWQTFLPNFRLYHSVKNDHHTEFLPEILLLLVTTCKPSTQCSNLARYCLIAHWMTLVFSIITIVWALWGQFQCNARILLACVTNGFPADKTHCWLVPFFARFQVLFLVLLFSFEWSFEATVRCVFLLATRATFRCVPSYFTYIFVHTVRECVWFLKERTTLKL